MNKRTKRQLPPQRSRLSRRTSCPLLTLMMLLTLADLGAPEKAEAQTAATCNITYQITTQWNVGFQAQVTVVNTGPAINGWTVTWTFPGTQTIYDLWNGGLVQSGNHVSVANVSYNSSIPRGGSVTFGFNANWSGSNPLPASFALNGVTCGGSFPSIITSATSLNVAEGGSSQFGVRLSAAPPANVTVAVARVSGDLDLTVTTGGTLTFTPANFATFQIVTISAARDADAISGTAVFRASGTGLISADINAAEVDDTLFFQTNPPNSAQASASAPSGLNFQLRNFSASSLSNVSLKASRTSSDRSVPAAGVGNSTLPVRAGKCSWQQFPAVAGTNAGATT